MASRPVVVPGWLMRSLLGRLLNGRLFRSLTCWKPEPNAVGGFGAPQLTYLFPEAQITVV